jgi:tetratricopeptide (TPR) repeat protein
VATSAAQPAVWGSVPPRNANFTGREPLLRALRDGLTSGVMALVPYALYGLGGVGKTQLAVEYAHRFAGDYELVWWVPAEQPTLLRASLAQLAPALGIEGSSDVARTVTAVVDALRRGEPYRRWLLVLDNADAPEEAMRFVPHASGHVVITSRNRSWSTVGATKTIEIDVFSRDESVQLLLGRGLNLSAGDADRLADKLGDLPLALEQAAAYQVETGISAAEYLRLLDSHLDVLLAENKPAHYPLSVAATWGLACEQLREQSPGAAHLLELCAFFGAEPIARRLLYAGRHAALPGPLDRTLADDLELNRAVRAIGRFSLARIDPARQTLQVHRLLQAVLRDRLDDGQRAANVRHVHDLLTAANPADPEDTSVWTRLGEITPHVRAAGCVHGADDVRQVVLDQIRYLYLRGDYEGSHELGAEAVQVWRDLLGADHERTLTASRHLANTLRVLGRSEQARRVSEETFDRMCRVFGSDHEQTLAMASSLAADLRFSGEYDRAHEIDRDVRERATRVLGPDARATIRCANSLGVDLRLLGRYVEALAVDRRTLETARAVFGDDEHLTYVITLNVARDLYGTGEYAAARVVHEERSAFRTLVGDDHGDVVRAGRDYAATLRKLGHYERARVAVDAALDRCRRRFGVDHPDTVATMFTQAMVLRSAGEPQAALRAAEKAFGRLSRQLGDRHPFTLAYTGNLAIILRAVGEYARAAQFDERALAGCRTALGDDHPFTLCVQAGVATDRHLAGDHAGAVRLSERTFAQSTRVRGPDHPYTYNCAVNLAIDLAAVGERDRADGIAAEAVTGLARALGRDHPETVSAGDGQRAECDMEPPAT